MSQNEDIVLTGEAAEKFEEYRKRPATQEEIDYFKEAEAFYLSHCPDKE